MSDISVTNDVPIISKPPIDSFQSVKPFKNFEEQDYGSAFKPDHVTIGSDTVSIKPEQTDFDSDEKVDDLKQTGSDKVEEKELSKMVQELNEKMAEQRSHSLNRQYIGIAFSVDKNTDNTIVKVTDRNTEELVRQIPSEEFLEMAERIRDMREQKTATVNGDSADARGILFDEKA